MLVSIWVVISGVCLGIVAEYFLVKGYLRRAYERGVQEGQRLAIVEIEAEIRRRETVSPQLSRVTVPNFGEPTLKVYDPAEFTVPLTCTSCRNGLLLGEDYYEIPITNRPKGSVTAVHLRCERQVSYG